MKPVHDKNFTIVGNFNRSDFMELPGSSPATAHLKLENPIFIKNTQGVVTSVCHQNIPVFQFFDMHDGPKQVFGRFTVFLANGYDFIKIQSKGLCVYSLICK